MIAWLIALAAGVLAALVQYARARTTARAALGALRAVSVALVVALLLGAPIGRASTPTPDVALDVSQSWLRASDSSAWRSALDSASRAGGTVLWFGDSLRAAGRASEGPRDNATRLRSVVDAATGSGRPAIIVTDGELEEPELLTSLPRGSRTVVIPRREGPDVAVSALEAPRALLAGDTVRVRVTLTAGAAGAPASRVELRLDDALLDTASITALAPFAERVIPFRGVIAGAERAAVMRATVRAAGDREAPNDTLAYGVDVTRAPAAVFVSTAPDYDAREAVAALRGVTSLPTRAFYRVAPGMWRTDGGLSRVEESDVRAAVRDAPLVIMHGDTSVFGAPRTVSRGALLLFAPPANEDGEFFAFATPVSPIAPALGALPFDSLPPLTVAPLLPRAEWQGLLTRRGGAPDDRRPALVGWETPRRIAVLGASGMWRWRFRGGVRTGAYDALFGALYDWLAEGRTDRRAVVPDGEVIRAGMPLRWRRGAPADSMAWMVIARRGSTMRDSLTVHFSEGAVLTESAALDPGIYDVRASGGSSVIAVNASQELVPRRVRVRSGPVGGQASLGDAPLLRDMGWAYVLVVLLLCAEWLLRRRVGLR